MGDSEELVKGIEKEALAEAEEIMAQSKKSADEQNTTARGQADKISQEAEKKAQDQVEAVVRANATRMAVATRRISLKAREQVIDLILDSVAKELKAMISLPRYREVLQDWIVEAAIGLNEPAAEVKASLQELALVDDNLLREAEVELKRLTGRDVKLSVSTDDPLLDQGIALTASDGRIAFNNQVRTRLGRYETDVRRIIYREFADLGEK